MRGGSREEEAGERKAAGRQTAYRVLTTDYCLFHHGEGPQTRNYAFGNPGTEGTEMGNHRLTLMNTAPRFAHNGGSLTLQRHTREPAPKGGSGA